MRRASDAPAYQRLALSAVAAAVALGLGLLLDVGSAVALLLGPRIGTGRAGSFVELVGRNGAARFVVFLIAGLVFLSWFQYAYSNVEALGRRRRFGVGWSIGGWLVPILHLWRPKQIANEVWQAADPVEGQQVSPLVTCWWLLFLFSSWGWLGSPAQKAEQMRDSTAVAVTLYAVDVAAAAFGIAFVLSASRRMDEAAGTRTEGLPGASALDSTAAPSVPAP